MSKGALALVATFSVFAIAAGIAAPGCSNTPSSLFNSGGPDAGTTGDGDTPIDPNLNGGDSSTADAGAGIHCSADLHDILDGNNNVIMTCPGDQGCGGTGCVPACDAAIANQSTLGCDYYAVEPDTISELYAGCFAAFVANTWGVDITLTADYMGKSINISQAARVPSGSGMSLTYSPLPGGVLKPNQVAILFLSDGGSGIPCPSGVTPGYVGDGAVHGTMIGHAFHFTTSAPVAAYDIYPYGGSLTYGSSATLLLPSSAWGKNYVAAAPFAKDVIVGFAQNSLELAASQPTDITISPTAPIVAGTGVAATGKGTPHTYHLNKGEVLQFTQDDELTGSPIQSTAPVGVWAAATCMNIDTSDTACDAAHQEIPPVSALGHEYVAVRYKNRNPSNPDESVPWRIVGAVNGTNLTYAPKTPMGAPKTIGFGKLATFWDTGPFVVQSQDDMHPFYMSGHMSGQDHQPASGTGDPEYVNLISPQEFLASYVFFTDPTYANTDLVVVRKDFGSGYSDVTLDCAGTLKGWKPISGTAYQYTYADLTVDFAPQGKCDNGRHQISSKAPFGLTVWAWDQYVSYAYPAGASVQPINTVVVPAAPY